MNIRPIENCISDTTDAVVGMMCDTRFHREVLGLTEAESYRLTGVHVCDIRVTVAKTYGAIQDAPSISLDDRIREIAMRISSATGANLDSCIANAYSIFDVDHRVDLGPTCDEEAPAKPTLGEMRKLLGVLM